MTLQALYTIGVYGFTPETFLSTLQRAGVDVLIDVRQRRGARGAKYAFANASRLDSDMRSAGISSMQWKDLAPSTELRQLQKSADSATNTSKSERSQLSASVIEGYRTSVLGDVDPAGLLARLDGFERPALLCVERAASACHRSLLAEFIARPAGLRPINLEP